MSVSGAKDMVLCILPERHIAKPKRWGSITPKMQRCEPAAYTVDEFWDAVAAGQTWMGAALRPGWSSKASAAEEDRAEAHFVSQQLFAVDVDNDALPLHPVDALRRAWGEELPVLGLYETFSSPNEDGSFRYRIVFRNEEPVTDWGASVETIRFLLDTFPEADQSCKNPNRLFAGCRPGGVWRVPQGWV